MKLIDLTNQRFGRLTVLKAGGKDAKQNRLWVCRCDCGKLHTTRGDVLKAGHCQSCGCLASEVHAKSAHLHATTHGKTRTTEYNSWQAMRSRCQNPNDPKYPRYGAQGIKVCERWRSFEIFYADMGSKPTPAHTIDRIDNTGNYEPANCRWATPAQQQRNRGSGLHSITYFGKTQCITDWAAETGVPREIIYTRINRNHWPVDLALSTPPKTRLASVIRK